jgi:hypothetical protein
MGIDDFRLIELGNETRQERLRFKDTELSVIVEDVEIERVELYAFLVERFGEADDRLAGRRMPVDQVLADRAAIVGLLFGLIGDFDPLPDRHVVQGRTVDHTGRIAEERFPAAARIGCLKTLEELDTRHHLGEGSVPVERHVALGKEIVLRLFVYDQIQDMTEVPLKQRAETACLVSKRLLVE